MVSSSIKDVVCNGLMGLILGMIGYVVGYKVAMWLALAFMKSF